MNVRDVYKMVCPHLGVRGKTLLEFKCMKQEGGCGNVHGWCPIRDRTLGGPSEEDDDVVDGEVQEENGREGHVTT